MLFCITAVIGYKTNFWFSLKNNYNLVLKFFPNQLNFFVKMMNEFTTYLFGQVCFKMDLYRDRLEYFKNKCIVVRFSTKARSEHEISDTTNLCSVLVSREAMV